MTISSQLYFPLTDSYGLGLEYREIEVESLRLEDQANAILQELALGPSEAVSYTHLSGSMMLPEVFIGEGPRPAGQRRITRWRHMPVLPQLWQVSLRRVRV